MVCPRLWPGRTVYLLGGGPSLRDVDLARLVGYPVIAINNAWYFRPGAEWWRETTAVASGPWPVSYVNDSRWFDQYGEEYRRFPGLKVSIVSTRWHPQKKVLRRGHFRQLDERPDHLGWGTNGGFAALDLAAKFGAARIVLLGFDMRVVDGRENCHDRHTAAMHPGRYESQFVRDFERLPPQLKRRGIEVVNATPGSALSTFPICHPVEVMPKCPL